MELRNSMKKFLNCKHETMFFSVINIVWILPTTSLCAEWIFIQRAMTTSYHLRLRVSARVLLLFIHTCSNTRNTNNTSNIVQKIVKHTDEGKSKLTSEYCFWMMIHPHARAESQKLYNMYEFKKFIFYS